MLKNVIKMLVIVFLYPVGDKIRMKMFNTKQRYLDFILGEKKKKSNAKNSRIWYRLYEEICHLLYWKFSRII